MPGGGDGLSGSNSALEARGRMLLPKARLVSGQIRYEIGKEGARFRNVSAQGLAVGAAPTQRSGERFHKHKQREEKREEEKDAGRSIEQRKASNKSHEESNGRRLRHPERADFGGDEGRL